MHPSTEYYVDFTVNVLLVTSGIEVRRAMRVVRMLHSTGDCKGREPFGGCSRELAEGRSKGQIVI